MSATHGRNNMPKIPHMGVKIEVLRVVMHNWR
jgi:hypothetical protein